MGRIVTRRCKRCSAEFEAAADYHRLCWPCWRAERDEQAAAEEYHRGYNAGLRAGLSSSLTSMAPGHPTPELLRDAVALCHPDRHPPERAEQATRVTAELLELRHRLERAA